MRNANVHYQNQIATENFYCYKRSKMFFTDGIKKLADDNNAYWLVQLVLGLQKKSSFRWYCFQVWELKRLDGDAFVIRATNGNDAIIHVGFIPCISFPFDSCNLWFVNNCLMLPSEY